MIDHSKKKDNVQSNSELSQGFKISSQESNQDYSTSSPLKYGSIGSIQSSLSSLSISTSFCKSDNQKSESEISQLRIAGFSSIEEYHRLHEFEERSDQDIESSEKSAENHEFEVRSNQDIESSQKSAKNTILDVILNKFQQSFVSKLSNIFR